MTSTLFFVGRILPLATPFSCTPLCPGSTWACVVGPRLRPPRSISPRILPLAAPLSCTPLCPGSTWSRVVGPRLWPRGISPRCPPLSSPSSPLRFAPPSQFPSAASPPPFLAPLARLCGPLGPRQCIIMSAPSSDTPCGSPVVAVLPTPLFGGRILPAATPFFYTLPRPRSIWACLTAPCSISPRCSPRSSPSSPFLSAPPSWFPPAASPPFVLALWARLCVPPVSLSASASSLPCGSHAVSAPPAPLFGGHVRSAATPFSYTPPRLGSIWACVAGSLLWSVLD